MSSAPAFPFPIPETGAEPYWAGCNEEELRMQRCGACRRLRWQPSPLCVECGAKECSWEALSGRGRVTTWTVITHPIHPAAVDRVPYVVAEIELEEQEGLRMVSALVDIDPDAITFDLPVAVRFEAHPEGQKLPVFGPA